MIKRLRTKFIVIAMASFTLAIALILGYINVSNYSDVTAAADERLEMIIQAKGQLHPNEKPALEDGAGTTQQDPGGETGPDNSSGEENGAPPALPEKPDEPDDGGNGALYEKLSGMKEAPYDTRFFTVSFNGSGEIIFTNTENIASVSEEEAREMAQELYCKGKTRGMISTYRYTTFTENDDCKYVFFDCSRELATFHSFLRSSILAAAAAMLIVLLLVMFLSRLAIRPVQNSYEKQKQFITDASHELKTPLAIISAANEVTEMVSGETEWTQSIDKQIKRLTSLTEKLVMLSRMDEESYTPVKTAFSLSDAVCEVADSFEAVAQQRGKLYTAQIDGGIQYTGDESTIKQLVSLLIDNAMKYSDENGKINVSLKKSGRNCELKVENTVENIAKGKHDEFFERFYRSDASRNSSTGGHGIGLSVAKAVVEAHKGKISAVSPDNRSIVFTVVL